MPESGSGEVEVREVVFRGRVQGVGFRATTRSVFRRHGLAGWVRNEPDGTVRMRASGEHRAIEAALADLRGVMAGNIEGEAVSGPPFEGPLPEPFEIR